MLRETLAPQVIAGTYLHPREVAADLFSLEGAEAFPMAVSALEMACWDLYGKVTEKPLWKLLGEEFDRMTRVAAAFEGRMSRWVRRVPATGAGRRARCTAARWWAWARPPKRWPKCASAWTRATSALS